MNIENPIIDSSSVAEDIPDQATAPGLSSLEALRAERDRLLMDKADLQDRLLRRQAEFENFRRRAEKEKLDLSEYAGMDVIKALLPALDDLDRALTVTRESGAEAAPSDLLKGMDLVQVRMMDSLKKIGLEPMESVGKVFDPHHHEAIERVETDEVPDQTVLGEYQRGFLFKGKLLRPAMVRVAVGR